MLKTAEKKDNSGVGAIRRIRVFVDRETLISFYNALVRPHFNYCSPRVFTLKQNQMEDER